jgi:polysaccharide pyruvyl transferase WcaK-like protein
MMDKKTCVIVGNAPTLGDLAIGWGLVELIKRIRPAWGFEFWTRYHADYQSLGESLQIPHRCKPMLLNAVQDGGLRGAFAWSRVRRSLESAACLVYQGGPRWTRVFVEKNAARLSSHVRLAEECARRGVPIFHVGTSIGPVSPHEADLPRWKTAGDALSRATSVLARDSYSAASAAALGLGNVFHGCCHDTALGINWPAVTPTPTKGSRTIAFNMRVFQPEYGISEKQTSDAVEAMTDDMRDLQAMGWGIRAVPMTFRDSGKHDGDATVMQRRAGDLGVAIPGRDQLKDPIAVLGWLSECTLAVTTRLHVAILAALAGVPSVIVGYADKAPDFAESAGLSGYMVDFRSLRRRAIVEKVEALQDNLDSARAELRRRVGEMRREQESRIAEALNLR